MTVKELKEILNQHPEEMEVRLCEERLLITAVEVHPGVGEDGEEKPWLVID